MASPADTQHTPVIIKNGGNGVPGSPELPVEIESQLMDFVESEPGPTWVSSQSSLPGRLTEVSIREGTESPVDYAIAPNEMASLRIEYGSVQIRMWESVVATSKDVVVLNIESDVPFNVTKPGKWDKAWATLPPITRVVFMAGNRSVVDHVFKSSDPIIYINFDRTDSPHPVD
jgi:hypothetical protein